MGGGVFMDDITADVSGAWSGGFRVDGAGVLKPALSGLMDYIRADVTEKTVLNGVEPRINHEKDLSGEQRRNKQEKA